MELVDETTNTTQYASHGVGTAGVTLGSIGTALGALNLLNNGNSSGLLSGIIGGNNSSENAMLGMMAGVLGANVMNNGPKPNFSEDMPINRYDLQKTIEYEKEIQAKNLEIAQLTTDNKFAESSAYTDKKMLELYEFVQTKLNGIDSRLAAQDVMNQANKDSFQIVQERMSDNVATLENSIANEAKLRRLNDNSIVSYVNSTFYPKQVAAVTTGTGTTAQSTYNPLPSECGCNS